MAPIAQPSLATLTERLLSAQTFAADAAMEAEVEPYEVIAGFRVDARTAWNDAILPLKLLGCKDLPTTLPTEWNSFAAALIGTAAVPMAAGNFPQQVRDLQPLLEAENLSAFRPDALVPETGYADLRGWIAKQASATADLQVLAAGIARSLGDDVEIPLGMSEELTQNELAAKFWQSGQHEAAQRIWLTLDDTPVICFNRGMALLFNGHNEDAVQHLKTAADALSDMSGWSHLAELYLALAEARVTD